ncbi:MAG: helix-turn-helix domain-containing protein [Caulobacterales bacterium]|nr:helix-turn-helix domain-containing protein [Caulobacterales bacterium]
MTDIPGEPRSFLSSNPPSSTLVRQVRWHTGLSQQAFALTFRIDPERLGWIERGEVEPDPALEAYLRVIDRDPHLVLAALSRGR